MFNSSLNLDTTFAMQTPKAGDIALVSQSGALWSYLADLDLGFSKYISLGNMMDVEFKDSIDYLISELLIKGEWQRSGYALYMSIEYLRHILRIQLSIASLITTDP